MLIRELAREIFDQLSVRHFLGADTHPEGSNRSEIRKSIELRIKEAIGQLELVPKEVFDAQSRELDALKKRSLELEEAVKSLESAFERRAGDLDEFLEAHLNNTEDVVPKT